MPFLLQGLDSRRLSISTRITVGAATQLFYLGQSLEHLRRGHESIVYYSHVITDFPLNPLVPQARARLTALKAPIPRPTRAMLARAQADASHRIEKDWLGKATGLISSGPDTSATLYGPVHIGKTGSGIEATPQLSAARDNGNSRHRLSVRRRLKPRRLRK